MNVNRLRMTAGLLALLTLLGCQCEQTLSRRTSVLLLESKVLDFGTVQLGLTHTATLKVRNDGAAPLNLFEGTVQAPFTLLSELPLTVGIGGEEELSFTYTPPLAGVAHSGEFAFKTDDPESPSASVTLKGLGVKAVATLAPATLDFGDVYVGENRTLTLTLSNAGTHPLEVKAVAVTGAPAAPVFAGDPSPLLTTVAAGAQVQASFTYAPLQMTALAGEVHLTFDALQGGEVVIPLSGRGVRGIPVLCFKFEGAGTESCTATNGEGGVGTSISVPFGPLCDNLLYPADGGSGACTPQTGQKAGALYVRNEGNIPVSYKLQFTSNGASNKNPCDAGTVPPSDFTFANLPEDAGFTYELPLFRLPLAATDAKPWETQPVGLSYRATSRCTADTSDQARVMLIRQGDPGTRQPAVLSAFFSGASSLPNAQPSDLSINCTGQPTCSAPLYAVLNRGSAPFNVNKVDLYEELFLPGGGNPDAGGPNGGFFQPCSLAGPLSDCSRFAFAADGGDPNLTAPHTLPTPTSPTTPSQQQLGTIVFCPQGTCPASNYSVYAVTETSDPYHPKVVSHIQASGQ